MIDPTSMTDEALTAALNAAERERERLRGSRRMPFRSDYHARLDAARDEAPSMLAAAFDDAMAAIPNGALTPIPAVADVWLFVHEPAILAGLHRTVDALDPSFFARADDGTEMSKAAYTAAIAASGAEIDALHREVGRRDLARRRAALDAEEQWGCDVRHPALAVSAQTATAEAMATTSATREPMAVVAGEAPVVGSVASPLANRVARP